MAVKIAVVLPLVFVRFITLTCVALVGVPMLIFAALVVAFMSAKLKLAEFAPPVRVVPAALMFKPCPTPTLFNKVTFVPAALIVKPEVVVPFAVPFKAIEPLVFNVSPVVADWLPVSVEPVVFVTN